MSRIKTLTLGIAYFRFLGTLLVLLIGIWMALLARSADSGRPIRVPSNVAWTEETIALASGGDAFRGLLTSRRCDHCHGTEGFSSVPAIPNLAGQDRLSIWKQLEDFRSGKRISRTMQGIANGLSPRDEADVAAYYSMLPTVNDPQDNRSFPQVMERSSLASAALRLIVFGDGRRGIPPCQSCHGPIAFVKGASTLAFQNGDYLRQQLENFADGSRANDINLGMRTLAPRLTAEEISAVSEFYGAGYGPEVNPSQ